ncbi:MAG: hypothetical protein UX62_C0008G0009 [Microgenomates group bacterium GW2011_GWA2_46_7]|nr:MAG: hypothetical protein UX62_C0008G0009 [Microgenomates group bacterium GW2011_GWA2_46_7]
MEFTSTILIAYGIAIFALILDLVLIFWLARLKSHYNSLTKGVEKKTLMQSLEGIQKTLAEHERTQSVIKHELSRLQDDTRLHIQNVVLKRFNPFGDTGGDQSFILAILDGNQDGVVITSLHSRENTRFYVKSVKGGVGIDHPLSTEEQKLINRKAK